MKLHIPPRMWPLLGRRSGLTQSSGKQQQHKDGYEDVLFEEALFAAEEPTVPMMGHKAPHRHSGALPRSLSRAQKLPEEVRVNTVQERYYSLLMSSGSHEEGCDAAQTRNAGIKLTLQSKYSTKPVRCSNHQKALMSSPVSTLHSSRLTSSVPTSIKKPSPSMKPTLHPQASRSSLASARCRQPSWICRLAGMTEGYTCSSDIASEINRKLPPSPSKTLPAPETEPLSPGICSVTSLEAAAAGVDSVSAPLLPPGIISETASSGPPHQRSAKPLAHDDYVVGGPAQLNRRKTFKERQQEKMSKLSMPRTLKQKRVCEFMEVQVRPHTINYAMTAIFDHFDNAMPLHQTIEEIRSGAMSAEDLPPIRVAKLGGMMGAMVSIDQRRLYVLKQVLAPADQITVKLIQSDWLIRKLEKSLPEEYSLGYKEVQLEEATPEFLEQCRNDPDEGLEPWTES